MDTTPLPVMESPVQAIERLSTTLVQVTQQSAALDAALRESQAKVESICTLFSVVVRSLACDSASERYDIASRALQDFRGRFPPPS